MAPAKNEKKRRIVHLLDLLSHNSSRLLKFHYQSAAGSMIGIGYTRFCRLVVVRMP